jgi:uncharacterized protein YneF (UPF0154 family)
MILSLQPRFLWAKRLNLEALTILVLLLLVSKTYWRLPRHQRILTRHRQVLLTAAIMTIQVFPLIRGRKIPILLDSKLSVIYRVHFIFVSRKFNCWFYDVYAKKFSFWILIGFFSEGVNCWREANMWILGIDNCLLFLAIFGYFLFFFGMSRRIKVLNVAEKPSVARAIADVLGQKHAQKVYVSKTKEIMTNIYCFVSCFLRISQF